MHEKQKWPCSMMSPISEFQDYREAVKAHGKMHQTSFGLKSFLFFFKGCTAWKWLICSFCFTLLLFLWWNVMLCMGVTGIEVGGASLYSNSQVWCNRRHFWPLMQCWTATLHFLLYSWLCSSRCRQSPWSSVQNSEQESSIVLSGISPMSITFCFRT